MSTPNPPLLTDLPGRPNPYTDERPLTVRDHPYGDNRVATGLGVAAIVGPLVALVVRAVRGLDPVVDGPTASALWIGIPLGLIVLWFLKRQSSQTVVSVGDTALNRRRVRPTVEDRTVPIAQVRGGLLATAVRYFRGKRGSELILFLDDGSALWFAGGLRASDVRRVADALSERGIKVFDQPISNDSLLAMVKQLRAAD